MHDPEKEEEANHMLDYAVFLEARVVGAARVSSCSLHSFAAVVRRDADARCERC